MKAIVLAGGYSSRFYPYSELGHKTMVKIMGSPILEYCLRGLKEAGIKDIVIRAAADGVIRKYFGDGSSLGLSIEYIEQREALGIGEVLVKARKFLQGDFIAISGNHINSRELVTELLEKKKKSSKGAILVRERRDPWNYGVVEVKDGKLVNIVEKPEKGKETSNLGLVTAFLLPLEIIEIIKDFKMYEFNFEEEVLSGYAKSNPLDVIKTQVEIATLKYPWDLFYLKNMLMKKLIGKTHKNSKISRAAKIDKNVIIGEGVEIMEGVKIKGPCYIGKNVKVGTNALIRNGSDLEEGVSVGAFTEIKNSLLMEGTSIHSGFMGDSIIGSDCKIGSGFTTANRRIDRGSIEVQVKDKRIDTGLTSFGAIVGNNVKIGVKVSTMPGVIIGNNSMIGPSTTVLKNVPDDTTYYTKFQEVVEKR